MEKKKLIEFLVDLVSVRGNHLKVKLNFLLREFENSKNFSKGQCLIDCEALQVIALSKFKNKQLIEL